MNRRRMKRKYLRKAHHLIHKAGDAIPNPKVVRSGELVSQCGIQSSDEVFEKSVSDGSSCTTAALDTDHRFSVSDPLISTPIRPLDKYNHRQYSLRNSAAVQLKIQTEVNKELKRLLVASVGSDLQLHLERLARERSELVYKLNASIEQLQEDYEEMDAVSIECDIWRSKYLASRVMINELMPLKSKLLNESRESQKALQSLLDERDELFEQLKTCSISLQNTLQHPQLAHSLPPLAFSDSTLQSKVAAVTPVQCDSAHGSSRRTVLELATANASMAASLLQVQIPKRQEDLSQRMTELSEGRAGLCEGHIPPKDSLEVHPTAGEQLAKKVLLNKQRILQPNVKLTEDILRQQQTQDSKPSVREQDQDIPFRCNKCKGHIIVI